MVKSTIPRLIAGAVSASLTGSVLASGIPVIDVSNLEQQIQNEFTNIAQYTQTVTNTLNSAQKLEQEVNQLGNFKSITNLPGVSAIQEGIAIYAKARNTFDQLSNVNPDQFVQRLEGLTNAYKNGFGTLLSSAQTSGTTYTIPMDRAIAGAVQNYQGDFHLLDNQRQQLEQQLSALTTQLNGAATQAEVDKLNGQIAAVTGQLNSVNQRIIQAANNSQQSAQQAVASQDAVDQAAGAQEGQELQAAANNIANGLQWDDKPIAW